MWMNVLHIKLKFFYANKTQVHNITIFFRNCSSQFSFLSNSLNDEGSTIDYDFLFCYGVLDIIILNRSQDDNT